MSARTADALRFAVESRAADDEADGRLFAFVTNERRVGDHVEFWLIDSADEAKNPNLTFVLWDAADTIAALRAEGRTVLVHCAQAMSRTPTVAALYSGRHRGVPVDEVWDDVLAAMPDARPNPRFREAVRPRGMVYEL